MIQPIDTHYIPDAHNAHIDTTAFKNELEQLFGQLSGQGLDNANLWPDIHKNVEAKTNNFPDEPSDDQIICRYLSPTKFQWFLSQMAIYFGRPRDGLNNSPPTVVAGR